MAVLNLRNVPDELAAYLKSEAALVRMGYHEYCVGILACAMAVAKKNGESGFWPVHALDGRTEPMGFVPSSDPRKKIAEISAGGVGAESGGTPDLPRLGKAQDGLEYSYAYDSSKVNTDVDSETIFYRPEMIGTMVGVDRPPHLATVMYGRSGVAPDFNEVHVPKVFKPRSAGLSDLAVGVGDTCALHTRQLPDGVPCDHAGCLSHLSHPCEGCGRIGGQLEEGCIMMGGGEDGLCSVASGCRGCSQERAQKNRGGSVPVGYTETRVAEMKEAAKTDKDVACALHTAGVELDREILVRWGLADNYKPITFENQRGVPGFEVVVNRTQVRPLVDKNKLEDEVGGGKDVEGNQGGESGASTGKNRRVAKGLPKNDDGGKSIAVGVGKPKVDMAALRDICAGKTIQQVFADIQRRDEVDLCGFKSYNEEDGENYVCGKEVHDSKVNHGEWIKV